MTVVTVYSPRLKDDIELVPRCVRDVLGPMGLKVNRVFERIDSNIPQGSHRIVVELLAEVDSRVSQDAIGEALKRLFNHVPPRREVTVEFKAA